MQIPICETNENPMVKDPKQPKRAMEETTPSAPFPLSADDAIGDARVAINDGLLQYLNSCLRVSGDEGLVGADLSDGLMISVLNLVGPNGKYAMQSGRFWQLLDQHCPFSPSEPEDSIRARLSSEIEGLFATAGNESFEDGFDSVLSLELQRLVLQFGEMALQIVSRLILEERVVPEVAAEALRCLGQMENLASHDARRGLLERSLACSSHVTRDGAVVGLSDLCDLRSIAALEAAAAREDYRLLRDSMSDVLKQLRELVP